MKSLNKDRTPENQIDTVLFDFDGTLVDTNELILNSWMYAIEKLTDRKADPDEVMRTYGEVLSDSMNKLLPEVSAEVAIETYRAYQKDKYLSSIKLYDGAEPVLKRLKEKGFKTAVVTSRLKVSTMLGLEHFGLTEYFDAIVTANDIENHKPSPEPLQTALAEIGGIPEKAVMVGDTKHDICAAKNAGVISVLVDYSVALPVEKRDGANPDIIIESLCDILALLGANLKN
ncbi:MAG: HAD-IA family hydrolase [Clostridiales Family XIII bacterium]|jgi:pyrophosphatase PpaX|nr:HAD-IA family hydrolase [Clostridiales Family XIII bacterium]